MANTATYNHVELIRVTEEGNTDYMYPKNYGSDVVIESDVNPQLVGYKNAQEVFNHLSSSAFTEGGMGDQILFADKWVDGTYSFEDKYPSDDYDLTVGPGNSMSYNQSVAWKKANIVAVNNTNVIRASGITPDIDLPVIIVATEK